VAGRFFMKNRRIFAIRKVEVIGNAAVIWISNSRFAISKGPSTPVSRSGCRCSTHRHAGGERSALLQGPVALSCKVTTHVNTVVTT
jgi:hypothetical protein